MRETQQKFFHTLDEHGKIDKQGMVLSQGQGRVKVQLFSWMDGLPNGQQTFDQADTTTWRFYDSKAAWLHAGEKVFA